MDAKPLCLDTTMLIAFLRNSEPGATAVTRAVQTYNCSVTAITAYELLLGVHRSKKEIGENALLGMMTIWPFETAASSMAAQLHANLIRNNSDIGVKDVMIAAICLTNALPILTLNERHFSRVPGLIVYTPATLPRR